MKPRLRSLDARWVRHEGEPMLLLQDRQGFLPGPILAPPAVALLLSLCDGTRDIPTLAAALQLRTGEAVRVDDVQQIVDELDEALVFESERFFAAQAAQLAEYRAQPHRLPYHAGLVYPERVDDLLDQIAGWCPPTRPADDGVRAVISPHIDYARGGPVYGETWQAAAAAARAADTIVIFGTDHVGSPGRLTLTRHGYRTPFGLLPPDSPTIAAAARAIGEEEAFAEELHHRTEHSIELAAVWLHWALEGKPTPIVPILCGSFYPYTAGERDPAHDRTFAALLDALHTALAGKRVLVVAAADLAHVGPAFGDPPFRAREQERLREQDERTLAALCAGDFEQFFGDLRAERDARKYCGLPPIYLTLRYLAESRGEVLRYEQCPADNEKTSWVTIAGVLLR
ncbi:MAG: AmmeMemoRadiSam system protein B [Chloroflexota bacterium]|nr:AmmeMemoRadiSam system protein B [Dehalococcoidia bacterium]MDW8255265.1 AmmeMemoRadiSam system protein B [Chloroflexota bacterium]